MLAQLQYTCHRVPNSFLALPERFSEFNKCRFFGGWGKRFSAQHQLVRGSSSADGPFAGAVAEASTPCVVSVKIASNQGQLERSPHA